MTKQAIPDRLRAMGLTEANEPEALKLIQELSGTTHQEMLASTLGLRAVGLTAQGSVFFTLMEVKRLLDLLSKAYLELYPEADDPLLH
jgi:hypothetical protein